MSDIHDGHGKEQIPLESFRILEDDPRTMIDFSVAIYSIIMQSTELRHYLQQVWHKVAYKGLNSAVVASLCHVAIATIKETHSQIFVEFHGQDLFHTIIKALTHRDPENFPDGPVTHVHSEPTDYPGIQTGRRELDLKERLLIFSYEALVEFIFDYRKTCSGKPTKTMAKSLQNWKSDLDLQHTDKEQRLAWRRSYTINWLYDLVNVFCSAPIEHGHGSRVHGPLGEIEWSQIGQSIKQRRLFGLTEFASDNSRLALQRSGTDVKSRILPHHVFQLQCIVDSLAVSCG
jgi:hypothetical protein